MSGRHGLSRARTASKVLVITGPTQNLRLDELREALNFYGAGLAGQSLTFSSKFRALEALKAEFVLFDQPQASWRSRALGPYLNSYFVDKWHPFAAWEWIRFATDYQGHTPNLAYAQKNFSEYADLLSRKRLPRTYVFGTGPSLANADEALFRDGYKIVCNTVVRNRTFFSNLEPDFIVAGDALYHFSYTKFAVEFRKDLRERLLESSCYFVYPAIFDVVVQREFVGLADRLVPIPVGKHENICVNLKDDFRLPAVGNVLPLLQLPLAATLSRDIFLWGYDGKAPSDSVNAFWANSSKHSYPELMWSLNDQFPGFFLHYTPENDSTKYIDDSHGLALERRLVQAEQQGFSFTMMHDSWTPTLARRFSKRDH